MPSQHKHRSITARPPDDLRERAQKAIEAVGSDMNAHVIAFLRWIAGDTDELPERPPRRSPGA